jgi:hypothetical protein
MKLTKLNIPTLSEQKILLEVTTILGLINSHDEIDEYQKFLINYDWSTYRLVNSYVRSLFDNEEISICEMGGKCWH